MATLKELIDSLPEQPTVGCIRQVNRALPSGIGVEKRGKDFYYSRRNDSDVCKQVNITCNTKDHKVLWMVLSGENWKDKLYNKLAEAISQREAYSIKMREAEHAAQVRNSIEKERAERFTELTKEQPLKLNKLVSPYRSCVNSNMVISQRDIQQLSVEEVIQLYKLVDDFLQHCDVSP